MLLGTWTSWLTTFCISCYWTWLLDAGMGLSNPFNSSLELMWEWDWKFGLGESGSVPAMPVYSEVFGDGSYVDGSWLPGDDKDGDDDDVETSNIKKLPPRARAVREAFRHAYTGYEKFAFPEDELMPLSNRSQRYMNGWGLTVFDAMDTLWLMGFKHEFERAVKHVERVEFTMSPTAYAPFFETVIRYLGGMLSAYALSGRTVLLRRADELAWRLLPAFDTPSGLPLLGVNTVNGHSSMNGRPNVVLAEMASCQMEYKYLAHVTGSVKYYEAVERVMQLMEEEQLENGLWYTEWDYETGKQVGRAHTVGSLGDSAYEYLLKQYLLSGRTEPRLRNMYLKATRGIIQNLLFISPNRQLLFASPTEGGVANGKMEHLACFLSGLFALGVEEMGYGGGWHGSSASAGEHLGSSSGGGANSSGDRDRGQRAKPNRNRHKKPKHGPHPEPGFEMSADETELHKWAALGLGRTCWLMYHDQPRGLGPEVAMMQFGGGAGAGRYRRWWDVVQVWKIGRRGEKGDGVPPGVPEGSGVLYDEEDTEVNRGSEGGKLLLDYSVMDPSYHLRPETVESFFVLWRVTHDEIWRDRAWFIFEAIRRTCVTPVGFASVHGVDVEEEGDKRGVFYQLDEMPSFVLAETFKYLFLTFLDPSSRSSSSSSGGGHQDMEQESQLVPMKEWVFNTEAHPLPVFAWSEWEKRMLGVGRGRRHGVKGEF